MRIAFVGLGRMGAAIAGNLLKAGHQLTVFNRTRDKAEALLEAGADWAPSAAEAAGNCEVIFTMLSDDTAATELVLGPAGIAHSLPHGAIHISLSTISLAMVRRLKAEHSARNQHYLSATVFGKPEAAASQKLIVVVAGDEIVIQRVHSLLDAMGRKTYVVGSEPWQANLIKLNGNFMIASMMETFGEAFATIRKAGLDHHVFHEIMSDLFGSPVYKSYGATIANQAFEPAGFALKLGLKDIRLGLEAAAEVNVPVPLASILRDRFLAAMSNGQEQMDWSSVAMMAAKDAGIETKTNEN